MRYVDLRVLDLVPGEPVELGTGEREVFVLPLSGAVTVSVDDERFALRGRETVFAGPSDFLYVGRDAQLALLAERHAQVALPSSVCERALPTRYGTADVPVEVRGAGPSTRQVRNFGVPGVWDHADRLMCCEVLTPPGNWSSYPPHKHDSTDPCQVANEEIYFYKIDGDGGFGLHRTYTGPEHDDAGLAPIDVTREVRDGDFVEVPYGYHGPCVAAPGYPMYYLNVLGGSGGERSMAFCDDPAHAWIRNTWT